MDERVLLQEPRIGERTMRCMHDLSCSCWVVRALSLMFFWCSRPCIDDWFLRDVTYDAVFSGVGVGCPLLCQYDINTSPLLCRAGALRSFNTDGQGGWLGGSVIPSRCAIAEAVHLAESVGGDIVAIFFRDMWMLYDGINQTSVLTALLPGLKGWNTNEERLSGRQPWR